MDGGYDYRVNETVNVVSAKTSEIGQRTWGIVKGVMALASQKVEEYTKEGDNTTGGRNNNSWRENESQGNGYYQDFGSESKGWNSNGRGQNSSSGHHKSAGSGSWDDWDSKDNRNNKEKSPHNGDSWAGWDDAKDDDDDEDDSFYQSAPSPVKAGGSNNKGNGKSDSNWTGGGFR